MAPYVEKHRLTNSINTLRNRGPDDMGIYISPDGHMGLGHRRLSIIDVSKQGHQPMSNEDGTVWITYNGEIYNFQEIKGTLESLGHFFKSNSDTEVIIHAYEEWGHSCLENLRGMFAFAIWNQKEKVLFLARDRFGIKPLYYYWDNNSFFLFASELKAIQAYSGLRLTIDQTALYDFFTYRYVPTPKTPYREVKKLPPAHYLILKDNKIMVEQFWDIAIDDPKINSEDDATEGLISILEESTRYHLVSDVPVGVLLSGGLDSSCITAFASRFSASPLMSFSVGFDVEEYSEACYARIVAETFRTNHKEQIINSQIGEDILPLLDRIYDEPFADSSAIPTLAIFRTAGEYVKTVLTGDGGDEVFGGYNWYSIFIVYEHLKWLPSPSKRILFNLLLPSIPKLRGGLVFPYFSLGPMECYASLLGGFTKKEKQILANRYGLSIPEDYDDYWHFRDYWREDLDTVSRLQYLDMKTYLPDDILTKIDRASMAVSVEARVPLLDHKLVEFVFSIHPNVRNKFKIKKYLFKRAMHGLVPKVILKRKKKGFSPPLGEWVKASNFLSGVVKGKDMEFFLSLRPSKKFALAIFERWINLEG